MGNARKIGTIVLALAAAGALSAGAAGTASAATPAKAKPAVVTPQSSAARSVLVKFNNWTGCTLTRSDWGLSHGEWTTEPPVRISDQTQGSWESESNGFMTGTEGYAQFYAENCKNSALDSRLLKVHWNDPYVGSNSYDSSGTDPKFYVSYSGGSGNNATVQFSAWGL